LKGTLVMRTQQDEEGIDEFQAGGCGVEVRGPEGLQGCRATGDNEDWTNLVLRGVYLAFLDVPAMMALLYTVALQYRDGSMTTYPIWWCPGNWPSACLAHANAGPETLIVHAARLALFRPGTAAGTSLQSQRGGLL
jgi:hypothetical protein